MADRIYLPRATDSTGAIVTDATAYFYEDGTSTPLTVYTDDGLGTPRGTSLAADAEGVFGACWVASGTGVKVDVQDGEGTSLPGYPNDDEGRFPAGGLDLDDSTFDPVTGNSATDGQTAIANNTAAINILDEMANPVVATGSGGAYAIVANTTISAYAAGQVFTFIANHTSVGSGTDTLNVDSQGAVVLKKRFGSTTVSNPAAGEILAGDTIMVAYDGTNFVIISHEGRYLDEDDMSSDQASRPSSQQAVKAYVDGGIASSTTTGGGTVEFALPSNITRIEIDFGGVSLDGTDLPLVQLSTSSSYVTSGYSGVRTAFTASATASAAANTAGFNTIAGSASFSLVGKMILTKGDGTDKWIGTFQGNRDSSTAGIATCEVTLGGAVDGVRLAASGSDTFDAMDVTVRYFRRKAT